MRLSGPEGQGWFPSAVSSLLLSNTIMCGSRLQSGDKWAGRKSARGLVVGPGAGNFCRGSNSSLPFGSYQIRTGAASPVNNRRADKDTKMSDGSLGASQLFSRGDLQGK